MRILAAAALIAGALIRIAIIPLGVPPIDSGWRAWSYHAATRGPWHMYGPKGHTVSFGDITVPVEYPPVALAEFGIIGRAHMAATGGRFDDDAGLTRLIKGAFALFDAAMAALIFLVVRRAGGTPRAWWASMAYWVNPAVLMMTTLSYMDVCMALPAVGAVIAASCNRPWLSGALFTAGVMTKPQGLFVAPAVALALWNAGAAGSALTRWRDAVAASGLTAAAIVAPLAVTGSTYAMVRSVGVLAGHNMLSALAFNLWWIVSYIFKVVDARAGGLRAALLSHPDIVTHAEAMAHGVPNPRLVAMVLLLGAGGWALKHALRARDLGLQTAFAAFLVVAYFTLSVQVHENHFFLALPLLAIAAALRPAFAPVLAALSVSFALNLYLIYGFRGGGPPEVLTAIDPSLPLAIVTCALFGWFTVVFSRECARPIQGDRHESRVA
jgi:hypothetical protein